jgi:two-component system, NtrC family, sensor kinase
VTWRARFRRPIARMRLRHKLAVSLSIAALLPVLVVWWIAMSVVLGNLEQSLRDDTESQLQVGLSLVLRTVERIGHDTVRVAGSGDLLNALRRPGEPGTDVTGVTGDTGDTGDTDDIIGTRRERVRRFLDRVSPHLPSSLVQVFDTTGRQLGSIIVGNVPSRFVGLRVDADARAVRDALAFQASVTIEDNEGVLVVHAAAPIVDSSYRLEGVVVTSVPLDGPFAEGVKSALGTDVLIFAGVGDSAKPALSTFIDSMGVRASGIYPDREVARRVGAGESVLDDETIQDRQYAVGYAPLIDRDRRRVGIFAVAVDRAQLISAKRVATRSLILGAGGAFAFALLFSGLISRRLTGPIARLHRGAQAVARGDLDYEIAVSEGDEIGDLATAFSHMTGALKENQERLAARMRELVALHDAARAVSSVIDRDEVLREIVDSVAHVFDVRLCALWLVHGPPRPGTDEGLGGDGERSDAAMRLELGAARAKPLNVRATLHGAEGVELAEPLRAIAAQVATSRVTLQVDDVARDPAHEQAALAAGVTGSLMAAPLEHKGHVIGVLIVGRLRDAQPFTRADSALLATFADQAASAVENARLYEEVRAFNEELEGKVRSRTAELTHMNAELGRALDELRETQAQLILSERMAGLGLLVAGVAHEINSPSAAIAGSADALADTIARLTEYSHELSALDLDDGGRRQYLEFASSISPGLATRPMGSAVAVRHAARDLRERLEQAGIDADTARPVASRLAELDADQEQIARFLALVTGPDASQASARAALLAGYLTEHVFLHRNALTIRNAIQRIQRIVGGLKAYSYLDQQASLVEADVHEGIEDTLVILDYVLRGINVVRRYGRLSRVPIYADELNQVWTNLIQNAVQALEGKGEITIETREEGEGVAILVIDSGPGIAEDVLPHIFEPFYTTKAKGEGTGLGLGIVRQIIAKHRGQVMCESRPGRTCFRVWLPAARPAPHDDDEGVS